MLHTLLLTFPIILCPSCQTQPPDAALADAGVCSTIEAARPLPDEVRETSGIALSEHSEGVLWTHNDRGGEPVLYSLSAEGSLLNRVTVTGAGLVDWEDMAAASCADGRCLYIADIGDNDGTRESITIYEVAEPSLEDGASRPVTPLHARYPDGPHNAEALFVLPSRDLFIVTKGDDGPIVLYRYPAAARAVAVVTLERVREIMEAPRDRAGRVTGAAASTDGRWVVLRTYSALHFYPAEALVAGGSAPITVDLLPLHEAQGEGVAMSADGTVWLSSEAEDAGRHPTRTRLMCVLPE